MGLKVDAQELVELAHGFIEDGDEASAVDIFEILYKAALARISELEGMLNKEEEAAPDHPAKEMDEEAFDGLVADDPDCPAVFVKPEVAKDDEPSAPKEPRDSPAARVFRHYQSHGHQSARLTAGRRNLINCRLKDGYSEERLIAAIDGYHLSPYHRGENDRGKSYLELELMLRNAQKIEAGESYLKEFGGSVVKKDQPNLFLTVNGKRMPARATKGTDGTQWYEVQRDSGEWVSEDEERRAGKSESVNDILGEEGVK